jgi:hypothetical protein
MIAVAGKLAVPHNDVDAVTGDIMLTHDVIAGYSYMESYMGSVKIVWLLSKCGV